MTSDYDVTALVNSVNPTRIAGQLAVLGGGAGLVLGKIASAGAAEHGYHQYTSHFEHWEGPGLFGDGDR